MSRNFTADQILTERLIINDTKAFEELYHRYWYSLYFYGLRKLQSKESSHHLVQNIFVELWQKRHSLTASFHLAQSLYEEGKKEVSKSLDKKIINVSNLDSIEPDGILVESDVELLQQMHGDSIELATQQRKIVRYVSSQAIAAEDLQVQTWPSETKLNTYLSYKEKDKLEQEILEEIQARTAYLLFFPKKESPWWQKIAAMF